MLRTKYLILPFLTFFILIGAFLSLNPLISSKSFSITGIVVDETAGLPLAGAVVIVDGADALTGKEGFYIFSRVPSGNHKLKVLMVGYKPEETTIKLERNLNVDVSLTPSSMVPPLFPEGAIITGKVSDTGTGLPVVGASVWIDHYWAITGEEGVYSLTVDFGSYTLILAKNGYATEFASIEILKPETYLVDVAMKPKPSMPTIQLLIGPSVIRPDREVKETSIRAVVKRMDGMPATGVTVSFKSYDKDSPGNHLGIFNSPTVVTDNEGVATVNWTILDVLYNQAVNNDENPCRKCLILSSSVVEGQSIESFTYVNIALQGNS